MASLLDGIKKWKIQRQEVTKSSTVVAKQPNELAEIVSLYSAICEVGGKNYTATGKNRQELKRIRESFSLRWNNLSAEKQKELVDRLFENDLLPQIVKQSLDRFGGSVVSLV